MDPDDFAKVDNRTFRDRVYDRLRKVICEETIQAIKSDPPDTLGLTFYRASVAVGRLMNKNTNLFFEPGDGD